MHSVRQIHPSRATGLRAETLADRLSSFRLGFGLLLLGLLLSMVMAKLAEADPAADARQRVHVSIELAGLAPAERAALAARDQAIAEALASGSPLLTSYDPREALGSALDDLAALGADIGPGAVLNFDSLEVDVPSAAVATLSSRPWVRAVSEPSVPVPSGLVDSEWLSLIGSDQANQLGVTGAGVTVAIIDTGFAVLEETIEADELPPIPDAAQLEERPQQSGNIQSSNGGLSGAGTHEHGTAAAEVVHEVAPGATPKLYWVQSNAGLQAAIRHAAVAGAKVILVPLFTMATMSDPNGVGGGGTNEFSDDIDYATALGATVVVSAGNEALRHYEADYTPCPECKGEDKVGLGDEYICNGPNVDDSIYHKFDLDWVDPLSRLDQSFAFEDGFFAEDSFQLTCMSAMEDGDCAANFRFQLYKVDYFGMDVPYCPSDPGAVPQTGTLKSFGQSFTTTVFPYDYEYFLVVKQISGDNSCRPRFRLVCNPGVEFTDYLRSEGSLSDLAVIDSAVSVGASSEFFGEDFSSQGPTNDPLGPVKPDLTGPGFATNFGAEEWGFNESLQFEGSSAAAAHVAGVAALIQARRVLDGAALLSPANVKLALTGAALDIEDAGPDNATGFGFVQLPASVTANLGEPTPTPTPSPTPVPTPTLAPGQSPTPAPTPTPTATPTPTPAPTPTGGGGGGGGQTPTPVPSPTPTPSGLWVLGPGSVRCGTTNTLTGGGFTAGSRVKIFVSTLTGIQGFDPYTPSARTANSLTWTPPCSVPLGKGFLTMRVINTDQGFLNSNTVPALFFAGLSTGLPTITGVNDVSINPAAGSIPLAFVQTVVAKGAQLVINGTGLDTLAKVNFFTSSGNAGPFDAKAGSTSTRLLIDIPAGVLTGPGSLQVLNRPYGTLKSNAVSVPVGAALSITSIIQVGTTITVNGTGFSSLSVVNFFNGGTNRCGMAAGVPRCPITLVSAQQFRIQKPATSVAGDAYIKVLHPPFILFTTTGTDSDGGFTLS